MPCLRSTHHRHHRRFLPHFPPGSMRCQFSPELVSPLPHAMREVFPKSEGDPICGSPTSPLSPLTPTGSSPPLIPKPSGEVSRIGRGGYALKNVLEQEHKWEDGLYQKIRVYNVVLPQLVMLKPFQEKVCSLADEYLDTSLPYSAQAAKSKDRLAQVCELVRYFLSRTDVQLITVGQVSKEFPILLTFDENWVVHDYLRIYLKNSAQKAKKDQQQKDRELETAIKGKARGAVHAGLDFCLMLP